MKPQDAQCQVSQVSSLDKNKHKINPAGHKNSYRKAVGGRGLALLFLSPCRNAFLWVSGRKRAKVKGQPQHNPCKRLPDWTRCSCAAQAAAICNTSPSSPHKSMLKNANCAAVRLGPWMLANLLGQGDKPELIQEKGDQEEAEAEVLKLFQQEFFNCGFLMLPLEAKWPLCPHMSLSSVMEGRHF